MRRTSLDAWETLQDQWSRRRTPRRWLGWGLASSIIAYYLIWQVGGALLNAHLGAILSALALMNLLDLRLRAALTQPQGRYLLDREGIATLRHEVGISALIVSDAELDPQLVWRDEIDGQPLDRERLGVALRQPQDETSSLIRPITPLTTHSVETFERACVACRLPHLPKLQERDQVGLFADRDLELGTALIWRSDLSVHVKRSAPLKVSTGDDLSTEGELDTSRESADEMSEMNRRPLLKLSTRSSRDEAPVTLEVSQGASETQRSNPGTLVNFSWCHTESVDASLSPYRILPPNDLGRANCYFATVLDPSSDDSASDPLKPRLCSALITYRPISAGEQLLAFTGSGASLRAVNLRRALSLILTLLAPALALAPWLSLLSRALLK